MLVASAIGESLDVGQWLSKAFGLLFGSSDGVTEEIMRDLRRSADQTPSVTAFFEDAAIAFRLPNDATFADLADRLGRLRDSSPIAVKVRFSPPVIDRRWARPDLSNTVDRRQSGDALRPAVAGLHLGLDTAKETA